MAFQLNSDIEIVKSVIDNIHLSMEELDEKFKSKIESLQMKVDDNRELQSTQMNMANTTINKIHNDIMIIKKKMDENEVSLSIFKNQAVSLERELVHQQAHMSDQLEKQKERLEKNTKKLATQLSI
mmetsp:Transcript_42477/g.65137  ORF Transcript_42477/g.65137 Transcript_42477/m.65137 type:complete len:126 (+) Transcript_42477:236-613(+)